MLKAVYIALTNTASAVHSVPVNGKISFIIWSDLYYIYLPSRKLKVEKGKIVFPFY